MQDAGTRFSSPRPVPLPRGKYADVNYHHKRREYSSRQAGFLSFLRTRLQFMSAAFVAEEERIFWAYLLIAAFVYQ